MSGHGSQDSNEVVHSSQESKVVHSKQDSNVVHSSQDSNDRFYEMEAAARARRARAVEELRHLSALADEADAKAAAAAAAEQVADGSDGTTAAAKQECNHFSIRGYVAMLQKKDPTLRSPYYIFNKQPQYNEHQDLPPVMESKQFRRWNCSKCLERMEVSGHRPASENVPMEQDVTHRPPSIDTSIEDVDPPYPPKRRCLDAYHANGQLGD